MNMVAKTYFRKCRANTFQILLCLPPHTTHYLQPLDRSFFKSLKGSFYQACDTWVKSNVEGRISWLQFGRLIGVAWGKSATVQNAASGFKATGTYPLDPQNIPDYAYGCTDVGTSEAPAEVSCQEEGVFSPQPSTSHIAELAELPSAQTIHNVCITSKITPGKALDIVSPLPPAAVLEVREKLRKSQKF
ncbi:hypothetical protein QE152_g24760 [Popillia japonica]|uniref:DDE-1 domain-containing protein n=1 Tax=Popillia japonica TaxID=7064 RepID=A0AAW1K487_POPJA